MLELTVLTDEAAVTLEFEHSLLSISKWEAKYKKAFMTDRQKTPGELIDYYEMMLMTPGADKRLVYALEPQQLEDLANYINEQRTASSVPVDKNQQGQSETITSELMYYWLTALRIPFQPTETWHITRLLMLVQIVGYKQQPAKEKRKPAEVMQDWRAINERQKKMLGTRG